MQTYFVISDKGVRQGKKTIAYGETIKLDDQAAKPLIRAGAISTSEPAKKLPAEATPTAEAAQATTSKPRTRKKSPK